MQESTRKWSRSVALVVAGMLCIGVLFTPAGAHVTSTFSHLWGKHIRPKLAAKGKINRARNPVHWTKLKGVPKMVAKPGVMLQRRVTGTCAADSSVTAIAKDGAVTCDADDVNPGDVTSVSAGPGLTGGGASGDITLNADSPGHYGSKATGAIPDSISSIGAITLPAGHYLLFAKLQAVAPAAVATVTCQLKAGGDLDQVAVTLTPSASQSLALMLGHSYATEGPAEVLCGEVPVAGGATFSDLRITAVKVSSLDVTAIP